MRLRANFERLPPTSEAYKRYLKKFDTQETEIEKLDALETRFHNPKAQVSYDILAQKGGAQLYSQLGYLYELILSGDGPPAQGWREVYEEQALLLKKYELEWKLLVKEDLAKLNEEAAKLNIPGVIVPPLEAKKP